MGTITRQGRPLNEEEKKEWEKAFTDMNECFKYLEEQEKGCGLISISDENIRQEENA